MSAIIVSDMHTPVQWLQLLHLKDEETEAQEG